MSQIWSILALLLMMVITPDKGLSQRPADSCLKFFMDTNFTVWGWIKVDTCNIDPEVRKVFAKDSFRVIFYSYYPFNTLPKGGDSIIYHTEEDIRPEFPELISHFQKLRKKYGMMVFHSEFPQDVDTSNSGSKIFWLSIESYANVDSIRDDLKLYVIPYGYVVSGSFPFRPFDPRLLSIWQKQGTDMLPFPNPSSTEVVIATPEDNTVIEVYDYLGRNVTKAVTIQVVNPIQRRIYWNTLPRGIYTLVTKGKYYSLLKY